MARNNRDQAFSEQVFSEQPSSVEAVSPGSANRHALRQGHKELALEQISWQDAVKDFLRQSLSAKERKTQTYYRLNLGRLARWAESQGIALADFRVRHLREYIAVRAEQGHGRGDDGHVN